MEITPDLIEKWENIGLLINAKNKNNLVFAYEYVIKKILEDETYYIRKNIPNSSIIIVILHGLFNKFTIDLSQKFIINKIDKLLKIINNDFDKFIEINGYIDIFIEERFVSEFVRENHFNIIL